MISERKIFKAGTYQHSRYIDDLYREIFGTIEREELKRVKDNENIICCPEPIEFIKYFDNSVEILDSRKIMQNLIDGTYSENAPKFKKISKNVLDNKKIWFHTTEDGVNLRLGKRSDGYVKDAIVLGDDVVHGVIVGRTGSGKSVFLNHLIMTMLYEYAPWELDLYLADLKKVELSRYMSQVYTPHVKTCAATGEIRYIISMLRNLYDCMQARQNLLAKLGLQKISALRNMFHVVLPRVVVIVDEFQQMYQEAKGKEENEIRDLIYAIIKLGRATGFHLIFASQDMSGALNSMEMANFKARFALPCDAEVSNMVLGNSKAADLKERGLVLVNIGGRDEEQNRQYRVPFIKAEEDLADEIKDNYFFKNLQTFQIEAQNCGFEKQQTFYDEDVQEDIRLLSEKYLTNSNVKRIRELKENKKFYYDIITLGRGVVYSTKKYDLETFFIEREHNKNIFAICSDVGDLAYIQKLFAINFVNAPIKMKNLYYSFCLPLTGRYDIQKDIPNVIVSTNKMELRLVRDLYHRRCIVKETVKEESLEKSWEKYVYLFYKNYKEVNEVKRYDVEEVVLIQQFADSIFENEYPLLKDYYYQRNVERKEWEEIFEPINIWISGVDYIEKGFPKYLLDILEKGMDVNLLFLLFSSSSDGNYIDSDLVSHCEYLFAKGEQENIYDKLKMDSTKRSKNAIAIDFKIKSLNTERAFKKYRTEFDEFKVPKLDFDELLAMEE